MEDEARMGVGSSDPYLSPSAIQVMADMLRRCAGPTVDGLEHRRWLRIATQCRLVDKSTPQADPARVRRR
jgi:hypothetical protein